jgi:hypothetical protein
MAAEAGFELSPGDVDAEDRPIRRQEPEVFPGTDSHFKAYRRRPDGSDQMVQNLHAGTPNTSLKDQEGLLPGPESQPSSAVIESCGDPVPS